MSDNTFILYEWGRNHKFSDDDLLPKLLREFAADPMVTLHKELHGANNEWLKKAWVVFHDDVDAVIFKLKYGHLYG